MKIRLGQSILFGLVFSLIYYIAFKDPAISTLIFLVAYGNFALGIVSEMVRKENHDNRN